MDDVARPMGLEWDGNGTGMGNEQNKNLSNGTHFSPRVKMRLEKKGLKVLDG